MAPEPQDKLTPGTDPLQPYRNNNIRLFIRDASLRQQAQTIMEKLLNFTNVASINPGQSNKDNIEKLCRLLMTEDSHVLFSPPPAKGNSAETKIEALNDFLLSVQARIRQSGKELEKINRYMSRIVPILEEAENYQMRMKYIMALAEFRITDVFLLPYPESKQMEGQIQERLPILHNYLIEHFTEKEQRLERIEASKAEADLSERKQEAEKLMRQAEDYKRTGNYEEAVQCYNKAIDVMPDDPSAYIESGRGYTKLKKYNRAIQRFTEAEEVAEEIPAPNQEIAAVRIVQVKEMIAQGLDPDSPEIEKLLNEAVGHYKAALGKASELKPLHQDDKSDRSAEAVSKIAGAIFKLELAETLGSRHAAVKELGTLARDSLQSAVKGTEEELPPSQMICLALADVDKGEFEAAEKLLFKAAADKKYTLEASRELNYMGTQVRMASGPEAAIALYRRILGIDPPNKAAIHYNLSVAMQTAGQEVEAAGSIVQAVYTDPSLPQDDMFYRNAAIVSLINRLVALFARVKENEGKFKNRPAPLAAPAEQSFHEPSPDAKHAAYLVKFEELIRQDRQRAFRVLYDLYQRAPEFYKSAEAYSSTTLMELVGDACENLKSAEHPGVRDFCRGLADVIETEKMLKLPEAPRHGELRKTLERAGDVNGGAKALYETYRDERAFFATRSAAASAPVRALARQALEKFRAVVDPRIRHFASFLERFLERSELAEGAGSADPVKKLEQLALADPSAAIAFVTPLVTADAAFFDSSAAYESEGIGEWAERTAGGGSAPPELARTLSGYLEMREKYLAFKKYCDEAIEVLMATSDQRPMANCIAKAIYSMPEAVERPYFYEHEDIVSAAKEICMKLQGMGLKGIG
ncbi:MAG: tetratricopeptide repeat protein [Nitrospinae bacterium]|nr:tetratricopeptide repeat protein [Nitrospinota bacterium]